MKFAGLEKTLSDIYFYFATFLCESQHLFPPDLCRPRGRPGPRAPSAWQSPTKSPRLKATRFQPTPAGEREDYFLSRNNFLSKKDPMAQITFFEFFSQIHSVKRGVCTFVSGGSTGDGTDNGLPGDRPPVGRHSMEHYAGVKTGEVEPCMLTQ